MFIYSWLHLFLCFEVPRFILTISDSFSLFHFFSEADKAWREKYEGKGPIQS